MPSLAIIPAPSRSLLDFHPIDMARIESLDLESPFRTQALRLLTLVVRKLATQRCLGKLFAHPGSPIFFFNLCIKFGDSGPSLKQIRFGLLQSTPPFPYQRFTIRSHTAAKPTYLWKRFVARTGRSSIIHRFQPHAIAVWIPEYT
jgi:hypothetical protein